MHAFSSIHGGGESYRTSVLDDPSEQVMPRVPKLESRPSATLLLLKTDGLSTVDEVVDDDDKYDDDVQLLAQVCWDHP